MDGKNKEKKKVAAAAEGENNEQLAAVITSAVRAGVASLEKQIQASNSRITALAGRVDEMNGAITVLASAGATAVLEEDDEVEDIDAAQHEEDEDAASHEEDEDAAAKKDDGDDDEDDEDDEDEDDVDAALENLEDKAPHAEPGEVNKNMKTKGNKTTTTDVGAGGTKGGLVKATGIAAAAVQIQTMQAAFQRKIKKITAAYQAKLAKTGRKLERLQAQVERYTELEDRRSAVTVPPDVANLLAKSNIDVRELQGSGQKLTVGQVDSIFAGVDADPQQRMAWKNRMVELGLMEQGEVQQTRLLQ